MSKMMKCNSCGRNQKSELMVVEEFHVLNELVRKKTDGLVEQVTDKTLPLVVLCRKCGRGRTTNHYNHTLEHLSLLRNEAQEQNADAPYYWDVCKKQAPAFVRNCVPNIAMMRRVLKLEADQPITARQFASLVCTKNECKTRFGSAYPAHVWLQRVQDDNLERCGNKGNFPAEYFQPWKTAVEQPVVEEPKELWFPPLEKLPKEIQDMYMDELLVYGKNEKEKVEQMFGQAVDEYTFKRQHRRLNRDNTSGDPQMVVPSYNFMRAKLGLDNFEPLTREQFNGFIKPEAALTEEEQKYPWYDVEYNWNRVLADNQKRQERLEELQAEEAERRRQEAAEREAKKPWYPADIGWMVSELEAQGKKPGKKVRMAHLLQFGLIKDQAEQVYQSHDLVDGRELMQLIDQYNQKQKLKKKKQKAAPTPEQQLASIDF